MRRVLPSALIACLASAALGCASGTPTTAVLGTTAADRAASAPPAASAQAAPRSVAPSVSVVTTEAAGSAAAEPAAPVPPTDVAAIPEAPMIDVATLSAEAPRRMAAASDEAGAQNILDPWRPYGVGVVSKTGTTVTLAWRTDLPAKAIVYFGKTFLLNSRGYDGVFHVNSKEKVQQVTISGLSRFRSYTFTVVGLGELGMQFPTYPFQTRTRLF